MEFEIGFWMSLSCKIFVLETGIRELRKGLDKLGFINVKNLSLCMFGHLNIFYLLNFPRYMINWMALVHFIILCNGILSLRRGFIAHAGKQL